MKKNEQKQIVEAILFTMGEAVEISRIADVLETGVKTVRTLISELKDEYDSTNRGFTLMELEDSVQLCTKAEMYEWLIKICKTPRKMTLTDTVLETLSIVAYKQPVTKSEIEKIRGVSCEHAVNKLLEYDLITEVGRLDAPGRPLLFGTTEQFLRSFGVGSVDELPEMNPERIEEFRHQAEEEVQQIQLNV